MKKLLLIVVLVFYTFVLKAQSKSLWMQIDENSIKNQPKVKRASFPLEYKLWKLDVQNLKNQLINAPVRGEFNGISNVIIQLPNSDGQLESFRVLETSIMEPGLAVKFPTIKSYVGKGIDDVTATARFSVTEFGLHSMTLSAGKSTAFIDPYTEDRQNYIVYNRASLVGDGQSFECLTDEAAHLPSLENDRRANAFFRADSDDKVLRTYRLAQSCTAEYGNLFRGNTADPIATQKGRVQAQMAITMTRVNGVYENDLAITMIFVANNDAVIYIGATNSDPWNGEFNTQTGVTIDANIGFSNYDIGHNFNTSGGGNAGCIGCVCGPDTNPAGNHKGTGYTGRSNPTGDPFDIDYVAHEMGHQFGGFHTQSSSNCRSGSGATEVEPGSGSTIMAYAGICNTNVQSNSDAYFTYVNIRDIMENVKFGISQPTLPLTNLSNNPPTANAGRDYVIPRSTAFMLVGQGSDPENDPITFTWEQNDPGNPNSTAAPISTRAVGPMFRSIWGTASNTRIMPNMSTVLTGATSNTWEVCPSIGRDLNFSLTVRDNNSGIGQAVTDLMKVTVDGVAGPFIVNAPNTAVSWPAGSNQSVIWDVAGTDVNGINAKFVDIFLSTDGGTTFPILLGSKVPNDGSETITVPNLAGTTNRIMVKGWDNIFFDVSNANFTITAPSSTMAIAFNGVEGEQNKVICQGASVSYTIKYEALAGFSGTTTFSASGNPVGTTVSFSPTSISANGNVTMTISNTTGVTPGFYGITVTATSGPVTKTAPFYIDLLNSNFATSSLTFPANNSVGQGISLNLTWVADSNASSYDVQVATDLAFTNIVSSGNATTNSFAVSGLSQGTTYYWRILPKNTACSGTFSPEFRFTTGVVTCPGSTSSTNVPINIPTTANVTINSTLNIPSGGTISDVNITMNVTHTWINDMTATLISPSGTQVQLFAQPCTSASISDIVATFDDSGTNVVCGNNPGISGTVKSSQLLSAFNGESSTGTWTLRILDSFNQDGGSLNSWSLNICTIQPLSSEDNEIKISDLAIYPNPNNGNFNIQFTSTSSNEIKVNVHDLRGREIFNKSYNNNNGLFNESLQLENVQSGVYLVTVQDGARKEVKKIVVQ
ncbi:T9SS type A sorting domain-containing protein [Flavobacterium sp. LMO8]|uniref:zinc-dependent metalloprotease n=1 Tax=Flavobacterium sp. LMO8 TaxID=2654244 RepID=UPI001291AEE4|nr:zinc-dependent metalloprotease family protein [Flavobacterium sp. LMO8]MQP24433.1 T9SS type A sorting domain-containing protein [Flavobacterium sp. LMO8]